jgi:hypothetical protein
MTAIWVMRKFIFSVYDIIAGSTSKQDMVVDLVFKASRRAKTLGVLAALLILALSFVPFIFPPFSLFFTDMAPPCLALYSPRHRLGGWKGVDRLASPCRLKNIGCRCSG